jgi:predicted transcriptional regulator
LLRLMEKGLVVREKSNQGKAFLYSPVKAAESQIVRFMKEIAARVFAGNRVAMLASLLDTKRPTADELSDMFQLLEKLATPGDRGSESQ